MHTGLKSNHMFPAHVCTVLNSGDGLTNTQREQRWQKSLQHLLSFLHHLVHQRDLEGQEVPEDQPNLLDQDLLCLPGKVAFVSHQ